MRVEDKPRQRCSIVLSDEHERRIDQLGLI